MDFPVIEESRTLRIVNKPFRRFTVERKHYVVYYGGFWKKREISRKEYWMPLDRWGEWGGRVTPIEFWSREHAQDFIRWFTANHD